MNGLSKEFSIRRIRFYRLFLDLWPTKPRTHQIPNQTRKAAPHYKEIYANRVHSIPRHATLQPQERISTKTDRTPFVISFNLALTKISSVVKNYIHLLQSTASCKEAFPNPPVIAYRRNASLRDLLVHSKLSHENSFSQQPAGIKNWHYPRCLTCSFLREGQTNYIFFTTEEARKITDTISCHSKYLIYLIECNQCHLQYHRRDQGSTQWTFWVEPTFYPESRTPHHNYTSITTL